MEQAEQRDLRIDVFIGDATASYRVTHIPSGVFSDSGDVAEALKSVNDGLEAP
jgi:hypothetical protein